MEERIISSEEQGEDVALETNLRPKKLIDYVGQKSVKDNLSISMEASKKRGDALDHVLFYGPPGLGKTTLANIIASEMGVNIRVTAGPAIERSGDMAAIITSLEEHDVLFIDEIHRLSRAVEEVLYPAMEDFFLSWVMGKGLGARSVNLKIPKFTLIGATTRYASISSPLRNRFGLIHRLDYYDVDSLVQLLNRSATILNIKFDDEGLKQIAVRSRGTPRIANRLLKRVRDYAEVKSNGKITDSIADESLSKLGITSTGLDEIDMRLLEAIVVNFTGGPIGLDTLAAFINEESETIMEVYEPYLLQIGLLSRTPKGRIATKLAYDLFGKEYTLGKQGNLI